MSEHINDAGEFQSDKYPTCPAGKVPLSTKDPTAQDLLWIYAQRRRVIDAEFADDLEAALRSKGYEPPNNIDGMLAQIFYDIAHDDGYAAGAAELSTLRTLTDTQARELAETKARLDLWKDDVELIGTLNVRVLELEAKLEIYERATGFLFGEKEDELCASVILPNTRDEWCVEHGFESITGLTRDEAIAKAAALAAEKKI